MRELTIVSPHRDDVPFSLYLCLSRWRLLPIRVNVVTVFTVSVYAPRAHIPDCAPETVQSSVTALRKQEDRRVFKEIDKRIRVQALNLLDAPLRLGIPVDSVCKPGTDSNATYSDTETIGHRLKGFFQGSLVLAPLGLGNHVDHLVVRTAAINTSQVDTLAFYEDLPYATWVSDTLCNQTVKEIERSTRILLRPSIIRNRNQVARKRQVISQYKSQIGREDAIGIAGFAAKYRGGERIWTPKRSQAWRALTRQTYV